MGLDYMAVNLDKREYFHPSDLRIIGAPRDLGSKLGSITARVENGRSWVALALALMVSEVGPWAGDRVALVHDNTTRAEAAWDAWAAPLGDPWHDPSNDWRDVSEQASVLVDEWCA